MIPYMKYHKGGDIHWQWYESDKHSYRQLVDDCLAPFKDIPRGSIVDIGSGDGLVLSLLSHMGFKGLGVEPITRGVEIAMQHEVPAEFMIEMAEDFAERKLEFDYLISINTIEHMDDPGAMLSIMRNIRQFGVIATDNDEIPMRPSPFHTKQFKPAEFEWIFRDFDIVRLPMRPNEYFAYLIKNKKQA